MRSRPGCRCNPATFILMIIIGASPHSNMVSSIATIPGPVPGRPASVSRVLCVSRKSPRADESRRPGKSTASRDRQPPSSASSMPRTRRPRLHSRSRSTTSGRPIGSGSLSGRADGSASHRHAIGVRRRSSPSISSQVEGAEHSGGVMPVSADQLEHGGHSRRRRQPPRRSGRSAAGARSLPRRSAGSGSRSLCPFG